MAAITAKDFIDTATVPEQKIRKTNWLARLFRSSHDTQVRNDRRPISSQLLDQFHPDPWHAAFHAGWQQSADVEMYRNGRGW